MTNNTITRSSTNSSSMSRILPLIMAIMLGVSVLDVAGHAQSPTLHGAAHDTRHATGFPCH
jgi:cobalt transporter subunit CbtB